MPVGRRSQCIHSTPHHTTSFDILLKFVLTAFTQSTIFVICPLKYMLCGKIFPGGGGGLKNTPSMSYVIHPWADCSQVAPNPKVMLLYITQIWQPHLRVGHLCWQLDAHLSGQVITSPSLLLLSRNNTNQADGFYL